jgi:hypothetical protein
VADDVSMTAPWPEQQTYVGTAATRKMRPAAQNGLPGRWMLNKSVHKLCIDSG